MKDEMKCRECENSSGNDNDIQWFKQKPT